MSFYHGQRDLAASLSKRIKTSTEFLSLQAQVAPSLEPLRQAFPSMSTTREKEKEREEKD